MKISRREFIKMSGVGLLGGLVLNTIPPAARNLIGAGLADASTPATRLEQRNWAKHHWAFVCDSTKCIGCGRCVVACKLENHVPREPEYNRTWVERYVISEQGDVFIDSPKGGIDGFSADYMNAKYRNLQIRKSFFVPKLCNHCDNPPCVSVCPVSATYMTKDGVVLVDQKRCIGCGYCIAACPYGARYLVPRGGETPMGYAGVADKCTWCYHRITKGLNPACVDACPVGARVFGDLRDPESPASKMLKDEPAYVLKPALGTKPKVYYVNLDRRVR